MARPIGPNSGYLVSTHKIGKYVYASTQRLKSEKEGKKSYGYIHWGTLDEKLRFHPGRNYDYASNEEKDKLIFPADWDLSLIRRTPAAPIENAITMMDPGEITENRNRFYGATWLLGAIANELGVRTDLMAAFNENQAVVDDILTVAMYLFITNYNVSRLANWQQLEKYPSSRKLIPPAITFLEQSITEQNRIDFLKCRASRIQEEEVLSVDSTTKTSFHGKLIDVAWGKNKEGLNLPVSLEVVAYSITSHIPVYYRTFPGNFPDARSIELICSDLKEAGFGQFIMVTDRAYGSTKNMELFIRMGQKSIMCLKANNGLTFQQIQDLKAYDFVPDEFSYDPDLDLYCRQSDISYTIKLEDGTYKDADRMKLNLYFDPVHRSRVLKNLDVSLIPSEEQFRRLISEKTIFESIDEIREFEDTYDIYDFTWSKRKVPADPEKHKNDPVRRGRKRKYDEIFILKMYSRSPVRFKEKKLAAGFRAILTLGVDMDPVEAMNHYALRKEQEQDFEQWKTLLSCDRERNSSEGGKVGAMFIQFVAKILSAQLRYSWSSNSELRKCFDSSLAILDEMRNIRCVEYAGQQMMVISPFVGKQITVCKEMGIPIPNGCDKKYRSKKVTLSDPKQHTSSS